MEPINDIALSRLQFRHGKVAIIEVSELVGRKLPLEMTSHLMRAKMSAIGKNREQMSLPGIGRFRLTPRQGTKIASKLCDMIDTCEHIQ